MSANMQSDPLFLQIPPISPGHEMPLPTASESMPGIKLGGSVYTGAMAPG